MIKEVDMKIFFWKLLTCPFRLFIRSVENLDKLPNNFILVGNHNSYLDGPILLYLLIKKTNKQNHFYSKTFWWSFYISPFECITRGNAVEKGLKFLRKKESIAILPEGRRNKEDRIYNFKTGVGALALLSGKTIIPVGIEDSEKFPWFFRAKVKFGKEFKFKKIKNKIISRKKLLSTTNKIMEKVAKLSSKKLVKLK